MSGDRIGIVAYISNHWIRYMIEIYSYVFCDLPRICETWFNFTWERILSKLVKMI